MEVAGITYTHQRDTRAMAGAVHGIREIAGALGVTRQFAVRRSTDEQWPYTEEPCRGGRRRLYAYGDLPEDVQVALVASGAASGPEGAGSPGESDAGGTPEPPLQEEPFTYDKEALWQWAARRPESLRKKGVERSESVRLLVDLLRTGIGFSRASRVVEDKRGVKPGTLKNWYYGAPGRHGARCYRQEDWPAALVPGWTGRTVTAEMDPRVWDWFSAHYLTRRAPTLNDSWSRTKEVAVSNGWGEIPSVSTFHRRVKRDVPNQVLILKREGPEALGRSYPPQRRDKTVFRAGEAVTGDGLKFDKLWIVWPDGELVNTSTGWFYSDIRTNFIIAYRLAKTENTDMFRLATYDLTGVCKPDHLYLDNTRVAANKAMTAGGKGRHRFKDIVESEYGLLRQVGIDPHWTNPDKVTGSPGAKPIERLFGIGGLHEKVTTNPRLIERGYSKDTAITYEEFAAVVAEEVQRMNKQEGRRTDVCRGVLSFQQAWEEDFATAQPVMLSDAQRQLLLTVPEVVTVDRRTAVISLVAGHGSYKNKPRYWKEPLTQYKGKKVIAYYDPADLSRPVTVHSLDGRYICMADHRPGTGFNDTDAAREHNKFKRRSIKATKARADAATRMSRLEMSRLYPASENVKTPEPGVVRADFRKKNRQAAADANPPDVLADNVVDFQEIRERMNAALIRESLEKRA